MVSGTKKSAAICRRSYGEMKVGKIGSISETSVEVGITALLKSGDCDCPEAQGQNQSQSQSQSQRASEKAGRLAS